MRRDVAERFRVNQPTVIHQTIEGETVIIHLERGLYYSLDETGAEVWQALASGRTSAEVSEALADRYPAERDDVRSAVASLVDRLRTEELIVAAAPDDAAPPAPVDGDDHDGRRADGPFRPPRLERFDDLQDLLLLDPIHAVDESGWPQRIEGA
jgi:coenzyme PQQ synthesis protein D (PqqD)